MYIPTSSVVAIRCPFCGQLEFHALSLFDFAGANSTKIQCSCGETLLAMGTKNRKQFWLQMECVLCEAKHLYYFTRRQIWSSEVLEIHCEETGLEIAYIGPRNKVRQCVQRQERSLAEMAEEMGFEHYFDNPDVMYGILDHLYQLAENGHLSCQCGNHNIEIEIFPDCLELSCDLCRCRAQIMAQQEEDLDKIKNTGIITLEGAGIGPAKTPKIRRHKKSRRTT